MPPSAAVLATLATLRPADLCVFTDGSAAGGVRRGDDSPHGLRPPGDADDGGVAAAVQCEGFAEGASSTAGAGAASPPEPKNCWSMTVGPSWFGVKGTLFQFALGTAPAFSPGARSNVPPGSVMLMLTMPVKL